MINEELDGTTANIFLAKIAKNLWKGIKGKMIIFEWILILVGPSWHGIDRWYGSILFDHLLLTDEVVAFYLITYYWLMM